MPLIDMLWHRVNHTDIEKKGNDTKGHLIALASFRVDACSEIAHLLRTLAKDKEHSVDDIGFSTSIWPYDG
jgi:hypothetical protein